MPRQTVSNSNACTYNTLGYKQCNLVIPGFPGAIFKILVVKNCGKLKLGFPNSASFCQTFTIFLPEYMFWSWNEHSVALIHISMKNVDDCSQSWTYMVSLRPFSKMLAAKNIEEPENVFSITRFYLQYIYNFRSKYIFWGVVKLNKLVTIILLLNKGVKSNMQSRPPNLVTKVVRIIILKQQILL